MSPPYRTLVISQRPPARDELRQELSGETQLEFAASSQDGLELLDRTAPDVVIADDDLAVSSDALLIRRIKEAAPHATIITLHEPDQSDSVVTALQSGAHRTLSRPVRRDTLRLIVRQAGEAAVEAQRGLAALETVKHVVKAPHFSKIVGSHPAMLRLYERIRSAAASKATVLVHGETGTGKELVAAAVHEHSKRRAGPFVRLNCAALAESVLESELFGHERGSFTGATGRRKGRFEQADGGTLFLDELSEMPLSVQVKLLRFLQERELERVGGNETLKVDVRVIAATNRDLKVLMSEGKFREDLYYRLRVVVLDVPPLRVRPSDIMPLAEHFLRHYNDENEKSILGFTPAARKAMLDYPWPGNVRELQHAMEQAVVLCADTHIDVGDLPIDPPQHDSEILRLMVPGLTLAELERYAITKTLEVVGGSTAKAASLLGISQRTVQYRIQEWGLIASTRDETAAQDDSPGPEEAETSSNSSN